MWIEFLDKTARGAHLQPEGRCCNLPDSFAETPLPSKFLTVKSTKQAHRSFGWRGNLRCGLSRVGHLSGLGQEGERQGLSCELVAGRLLQYITHVCALGKGKETLAHCAPTCDDTSHFLSHSAVVGDILL